MLHSEVNPSASKCISSANCLNSFEIIGQSINIFNNWPGLSLNSVVCATISLVDARTFRTSLNPISNIFACKMSLFTKYTLHDAKKFLSKDCLLIDNVSKFTTIISVNFSLLHIFVNSRTNFITSILEGYFPIIKK